MLEQRIEVNKEYLLDGIKKNTNRMNFLFGEIDKKLDKETVKDNLILRVLIKKQDYINNNQANINNKNEDRFYCLFDMCRKLEKQNKIKDIVILANTIGLLLFTIIMFVSAML